MSARRASPRPHIAPDGNLDPESLADMGQRWILGWLRARLAGKDPILPLDPRSDEDPDARIVSLLRSAGPLHPGSRAIGRACLRLLEEAAADPAQLPVYFASLLRLCQQVRIPDTEPWFAAFVNELARCPEALARRWSRGLTREILYAALRQPRSVPASPVQASWRRLLEIPEYTTFALIALSPSWEAEMEHLPTWWSACPASERSRELRQEITRAWKAEGEQRLREVLSSAWHGLPVALRAGVNSVLSALRLAPIDPAFTAAVGRAILNAALRPQEVLSRDARLYQRPEWTSKSV